MWGDCPTPRGEFPFAHRAAAPMVGPMKLCPVIFALLFGVLAPLSAAAPAAAVTGWDLVNIPPMKTSLLIGSVTLTTEPFVRSGSTLASTYQVKVWPWFFWSESGRITISLTDANLASMAKSETSEFTGEAANHRNKPRQVTGRTQPTDGSSGKFKIRIKADGYELVFNGTYRFGEVKRADQP